MDSNRFIVFPVLLLAEKHSSFITVQAEEDAVFSENANMFARVLLYTKRVSVRACFLRLSTEKRKQQKRAKCRERERYDGGDINDLSMDNLSGVFAV